MKEYLCIQKSQEIEVLELSTGESSKVFNLGSVVKIIGANDGEIEVQAKEEVLTIWKINLKTGKTEKISGSLKGTQFCLKNTCVSQDKDKVEIYEKGKFFIKEWKGKNIAKIIKNSNYVLTEDHEVYEIKENYRKIVTAGPGIFSAGEDELFWISPSLTEFNLVIYNINEGTSKQTKVIYKEKVPQIEHFWGFLTQKGEFVGFLTLSDFSFTCFTSTEIKWIREEGLGHLKHVYFAELPNKALHHSNDYISSIKQDNSWVKSPFNFLLRLKIQLQSFSLWLEGKSKIDEEKELIRDVFGINKLILGVSASNYIFALQSLYKNTVWKKSFIEYGEFYQLVQTDIEEILLIFKENKNIKLVWILSTSGETIKTETIKDFDLLEAIILDKTEKPGVLLVSNSLKVKNVTKDVKAENIYFYKINSKENTIFGYKIVGEDSQLVWSMALSAQEEIKAFATEKESKIHQPSIATGTSRLIYKHDDANMFALATIKSSDLYIYVVNGVSGSILTKLRQEGVSGSVNLVLHENKLIGHYWNSKYSRYEMIGGEFFDSQVDTSATHVLASYYEGTFEDKYSSFDMVNPIIFTQTYAFPGGIKDMKVTRTLQGITTPDLVMILNTNQVYTLNLKWLSARRKQEEDKTEGIFDQPNLPIYKPNLPLVQHNILTYYLNLDGLEQLEITWTLLESTSLAVAYGLDLFVVRVMPEKSFDILTREFSRSTIVMTILGLILLNVVVERYFSYKTQKNNFKQ